MSQPFPFLIKFHSASLAPFKISFVGQANPNSSHFEIPYRSRRLSVPSVSPVVERDSHGEPRVAAIRGILSVMIHNNVGIKQHLGFLYAENRSIRQSNKDFHFGSR